MAGYNRIIMVGNLTRDPEMRQVGSGSVCRMTIASNRSYKNKQTGALQQDVCYIDVDVWGPQAETSHTYLQKGRMVLVEGRLKLDSWKDNEGQARSKHSIVADRVVFLQSGAGASEDVGMSDSLDSGRLSPELMLDETALKPAKAPKKKASFKDEAPFEDDLPF